MSETATRFHDAGRDPTLIGCIRHVMGATVIVELLKEVAGSTPLYQGHVYHIGQIGSLVTVPQGPLRLIGAVTMLGIAELVPPPEPANVPQQGDRWLKVQLLGELDPLGKFQRGVSTFPAIEDEVHFATSQELAAIYPPEQIGFIPVGRLSTSRSHIMRLDLARLVTRHAAVVGSTGSGKSCTVARVIQEVLALGFLRANIVIIDPHGEYATTFWRHATVMSVTGRGKEALSIPYWALGLDDLIRAYLGTGTTVSPVVRHKVQELVLAQRKKYLGDAGWASPSPDDITVDTPIPFDLREVWHKLDFENRATVHGTKTSGNYAIVDPGDARQLKPAKFQPYNPAGESPHKSPTFGHFSPLPDRMFVRLKDPLFRFLSRSYPDPSEPDPLPDCLSHWLGRMQPVSVLDFSGVPSEAADVAIGTVLSLLFDVAVACPPDRGIGRARPIWIVLEEAHRFIGDRIADTAGAARQAAERIAREGRKYGVGLMLVSQRPAELSETALSQCGTILSMRLTNPGDQSRVQSALPDTVATLAEALPALRTGEALITGEATALPTRVLIEEPNPVPAAHDPSIKSWRGAELQNDVTDAVSRWRGAAEHEMDEPE